MLDRIKQIDTELLIFLNNLGNKSWDPLWVSITDKFTFLPLFILIIFFLFKKNGTKGLLVILLFISVLILFTDQFTNVVKDFTQRLRPCRLDELQGLLRDIDIRRFEIDTVFYKLGIYGDFDSIVKEISESNFLEINSQHKDSSEINISFVR